ncbi:winged helix-turn-helix domain-containing protein [Synechocystis sp. PCC 7509]|uniref:winged helix-turn-helix domain-containing protein n=1 Tax=Synechocystis sp. PCC 7509 TaxID=927677 RepID=UPI0002ACB55A|nr:winged helix-turn-helix domain-containing protein [Synechocystis sp. PCC 7509]
MNQTFEMDDDLRPEYNFTQLPVVARGQGRKKSTLNVQLDPDVAAVFPDYSFPMKRSSSLIPTFDSMLLPTIQALQVLGGSGTTEEIYEKVAQLLDLPDEVLNTPHGSTSQSEVEYRLGWSRTYLKKYGLLQNSERGVWSLISTSINIDSLDAKEIVKIVREADKSKIAQPAQSLKPFSSNLAVTRKRLTDLLEAEETDDYGILQPSQSAFKLAIQFVVEAYELMGDNFPKASVSTDEKGGIRLTWSKLEVESEVRLICPGSKDQPVYLYHELGDNYAVEHEVTSSILMQWLEWLNRA